MTTSSDHYEQEIVFDSLNCSWYTIDNVSDPHRHILTIECRIINNNKTTGHWLDIGVYIRYTMEGKGPITQNKTSRYLIPKDSEHKFGHGFSLSGDKPDEFTELEYGFRYTAVARPIQGHLNRTIHPKGS